MMEFFLRHAQRVKATSFHLIAVNSPFNFQPVKDLLRVMRRWKLNKYNSHYFIVVLKSIHILQEQKASNVFCFLILSGCYHCY